MIDALWLLGVPLVAVASYYVSRWSFAWRERRRRAAILKRITRELGEEWAKAWKREIHTEAGPPPNVSPAEWGARLREMIASYDEPANRILPVGAGRVEASFDINANRINAKIPATWDLVAAMAWERYERGETHAQVTAWLEAEIKQGWRDILSEVFLADGSPRWAYLGEIRWTEVRS